MTDYQIEYRNWWNNQMQQDIHAPSREDWLRHLDHLSQESNGLDPELEAYRAQILAEQDQFLLAQSTRRRGAQPGNTNALKHARSALAEPSAHAEPSATRSPGCSDCPSCSYSPSCSDGPSCSYSPSCSDSPHPASPTDLTFELNTLRAFYQRVAAMLADTPDLDLNEALSALRVLSQAALSLARIARLQMALNPAPAAAPAPIRSDSFSTPTAPSTSETSPQPEPLPAVPIRSDSFSPSPTPTIPGPSPRSNPSPAAPSIRFESFSSEPSPFLPNLAPQPQPAPAGPIRSESFLSPTGPPAAATPAYP